MKASEGITLSTSLNPASTYGATKCSSDNKVKIITLNGARLSDPVVIKDINHKILPLPSRSR